jgi:hypothetical protein
MCINRYPLMRRELNCFGVRYRAFICTPDQLYTMSKIRDILWEAVQGKEKQFTTGSIKKAIVLLSIPMILEMAMESLFAVVDVFFVSRIGVEAVNVVGLTESVITIIYSLAWGIAMAATAMVARRIGEGQARRSRQSSGASHYTGPDIGRSVGRGRLHLCRRRVAAHGRLGVGD